VKQHSGRFGSKDSYPQIKELVAPSLCKGAANPPAHPPISRLSKQSWAGTSSTRMTRCRTNLGQFGLVRISDGTDLCNVILQWRLAGVKGQDEDATPLHLHSSLFFCSMSPSCPLPVSPFPRVPGIEMVLLPLVGIGRALHIRQNTRQRGAWALLCPLKSILTCCVMSGTFASAVFRH
jgi:hypothetical protein